ncbi:hypothetical protein GEMRC1_001251 [Eukaryota sp. GEM-RC1]
MGLNPTDRSLITVFCQRFSLVRIEVAEWEPSRFIYDVNDSLLSTVDYIATHSHLLGPFAPLSSLYSVATLVARLLSLINLAFQELDFNPSRSQPSTLQHTLDFFQEVCRQTNDTVTQFNDENWFQLGFNRDKFEQEFVLCHKRLNDLTQELNSSLSFTHYSEAKVRSILHLDEEDFYSTVSKDCFDQLKIINDECRKVQVRIDTTTDPLLVDQLKNKLHSLEVQRDSLYAAESNVPADIQFKNLIPESAIILEDSFSKISGQSEILFAQWMNSDVVIKLYHAADDVDPSLAREWEILSSVPDVPSLPRVFGVTRINRNGSLRYGLVMERLSRETLAHKVSEDLSPSAKLQIVSGIACALNVCHDLMFLHRDLKPDNILFRGDAAVLIDWGSGKNIGKSNMSMSMNRFFTTKWASPEAISDQTIYTNAIDVFSFGLLAVYIFTGKSIWHHYFRFPNSDALIIQALKTGNIPVIFESGDIPSTLLPLIRQCLSVDYTKRPTMAEVFSVLVAHEQRYLPVQCLSLENSTLCEYGLSMITEEYVVNSLPQTRVELFETILNLLEHCHCPILIKSFQKVITILQTHTNLTSQHLDRKSGVYNLLQERLDAHSKIPVFDMESINSHDTCHEDTGGNPNIQPDVYIEPNQSKTTDGKVSYPVLDQSIPKPKHQSQVFLKSNVVFLSLLSVVLVLGVSLVLIFLFPNV